MVKKIITSILVLIIIFLGIQASRILILDNTSLLMQYNNPKEVSIISCFPTNEPNILSKKSIKIKDKAIIERLHKAVRNRIAYRVSAKEADQSWDKRILLLEYDSHKRFSVDEKGRIYFSVDKGEIRNSSPLHWLWWKYDNTINNRTYIVYLTNPNNEVLAAVKNTIGASTTADQKKNALEVLNQYFSAFAKGDYNTMKTLATEYHNKNLVHNSDVWGMKWAKAKEINIENHNNFTNNDYNESILVFSISVDTETVKTSAIYPSTQNFFYLILVRGEDEIWRVDRYSTG